MTGVPTLYFDLGSPYAYLAVHRAESVLGVAPRLQPVLLGALFAHRGHGSWSETPQREAEIAEVEARAASYGLPPLCWPSNWPASSLIAMRAATFAAHHDAVVPFARAVFHAVFATGGDVTDLALLGAAAREAGLDADAVLAATADPAIKQELRQATDDAWAAGVRGVPATRVGATVFYGDDRLELAAEALSA